MTDEPRAQEAARDERLLSDEDLGGFRNRHREVVYTVTGGEWDELVGEGQGECEYCNSADGSDPTWPCDAARLLADRDALAAENARLVAALEKLNAIRDETVLTQRATWSSLVYPLVAILNEAGVVSTITGDEVDLLPKHRIVGSSGYSGEHMTYTCSCGFECIGVGPKTALQSFHAHIVTEALAGRADGGA